jgi:hypothetical protein
MSKTKSLLASLYEREVIPLFEKEGLGKILLTLVFSIMDSLVTTCNFPLSTCM